LSGTSKITGNTFVLVSIFGVSGGKIAYTFLVEIVFCRGRQKAQAILLYWRAFLAFPAEKIAYTFLVEIVFCRGCQKAQAILLYWRAFLAFPAGK